MLHTGGTLTFADTDTTRADHADDTLVAFQISPSINSK